MLPYTGFGIPLVAFNAVTNLETSSVGTGAPVLAALPSTTSNKVFNSIKGDGTTTEVTVAPPLTGGDIVVACTSNMLDKTTDQTITSTKTFTKPPIIPTITADGINNITVPTTAGTMALTSQIPSVSSLVTGPGSAVSGNIATYNGTSGKLIQDSGVPITNVATKAGSETLTNKTIDSALNTLTITNSPLSATNVNSLINQDIRTTASPTFATQTLTSGLLLPTSGGTPSTLNFYEVYQGSITWSGLWASSQTANVTYVRLGNIVTVAFQRAFATATIPSQITSDAIPARFRPSATGSNATVYAAYPIWAISNNVGTTAYIYYVSSGTKWQIAETAAKAASGAGWTGAGASGILESGFTYWV